jgi:hypothetical protein
MSIILDLIGVSSLQVICILFSFCGLTMSSSATLPESDICSICYESEHELLPMPCCHRDGGSVHYCRRCLEVICEQPPVGVGQCPTCRSFFTFENGRVVKTERKEICIMCQQLKIIVNERKCSACSFGSLYSFRYECERCHREQRIPHPMWRYQPSCDAFGTSTWACHRGCGTYTHWRIVPADLASVPLADVPASWELCEGGLVSRVRAIRQAEATGTGAGARRPAGPVDGDGTDNSAWWSCAVS